jgi:hypothetical protein
MSNHPVQPNHENRPNNIARNPSSLSAWKHAQNNGQTTSLLNR